MKASASSSDWWIKKKKEWQGLRTKHKTPAGKKVARRREGGTGGAGGVLHGVTFRRAEGQPFKHCQNDPLHILSSVSRIVGAVAKGLNSLLYV